jgi:hypothetical protein
VARSRVRAYQEQRPFDPAHFLDLRQRVANGHPDGSLAGSNPFAVG